MDARAAILAADPAARVMVGGLVGITATVYSPWPVPAPDCTVQEFLADMRAHRCDLAMDAVAIHIYAPTASAVLAQLA